LQYLKYAIIPIILGVILISCEKDDNSIIDPILKFPRIDSASFTPTSYNSDTINGIATAWVSSEDPVKQVSVTIYNPGGAPDGTFLLKDDGVSPDLTAGDGIYTGRIIHTICRYIGDWKCEFIAENESGLFSNTYNNTFVVINSSNHPPVISSLVIVPDSLSTQDSVFFIFTVRAVDQDGSCDIRKVFYRAFNPSNIEITPQELFDDGSCCPIPPFNTTSGDTTANDSWFTRKFFGRTTTLGYFRYYIRAVDRTGDTSNVLADSIYIYP